MAIEFNVTAADGWFLGEDKLLSIEIIGQDAAGLLPGETGYVRTPVDVTDWALEYIIRLKDKDPDPPLLRKETGEGIEIMGTFNETTNTQRVQITIDSPDTTDWKAKTYRHSLKRTDLGDETILFWGGATLLQATAH